jgi:uncharacterized protein (DUF1015 family)
LDNSVVVPFRALRYRVDKVSDLGAVWAPPYDVIGAAEAAALRERSPYNIVRVTNPQGDGPERYAVAAQTLNKWISEQVMASEEEPAFFIHQHEFESADTQYVRTGIWALLKLEPFEAGIVLPHERTMKGPKADRLALMQECSAQLSPIFFICSDPDGRISNVIKDLVGGSPTEEAEFPTGQTHKVWRVEPSGPAIKLGALLDEQTFLIADGHHRYETALAYSDALIEEGAPQTGRNAHEYVLAYIAPESDPGLQLLPTHRAIVGDPLDWEAAVLKMSEKFDVVDMDAAELDSAGDWLNSAAGQPAFVLVAKDRPGAWLLRQREPDAFTTIAAVAFHEVFMFEGLGLSSEEQEPLMRYTKDPAAAVDSVRSGKAQAAALLAAPLVVQVREAAAAGERTPTKTTFFWPKVPTGVAVHLIDPGEDVVS